MPSRNSFLKSCGYYNSTDAANHCGIEVFQLKALTKKYKVLPEPSHSVGTYRGKFYTLAEVDELKKLFDKFRADKAAERATKAVLPATDKG